MCQGSHSDLKTWKNGKAFSIQGILNRLEKSGKITQNSGKLREFEINIIAKMDQVFSLKKNIKKILEKMAQNTGKIREFCQSGKVGTL